MKKALLLLLASALAYLPVFAVLPAKVLATEPVLRCGIQQEVTDGFSGLPSNPSDLDARDGSAASRAKDQEKQNEAETDLIQGDPVSSGRAVRTYAAVPQDGTAEEEPAEGSSAPAYTLDPAEYARAGYSADQVRDDVMAHGGFLQDGKLSVCSGADLGFLGGTVPVLPSVTEYLATLEYPVDRITFSNPADRYALAGEPCSRFQEDGTCNEEKSVEPVRDAYGEPILGADGRQEMESKPKYYDDSIWPNGKWDAPKADQRILKLLTWLVTPAAEGGAGREKVSVGKILQDAKGNQEFAPLNGGTDGGDSAHAYDTENPSHPAKIATAVDITAIDSVRVTTKITTKSRFGDLTGGNAVKYQYRTSPINVSYQTAAGAAKAPLPLDGRSMFDGAVSGFSLSLAQILDQLGLSADIDASTTDVSSLTDIAGLLGQSVLGALIGSPDGIKGWNPSAIAEQLGRSYLAAQIGLPRGSLAEGKTPRQLLRSIGRSQVEKQFGFSNRSLVGTTTDEVLINLALRSLEDILQLSGGTLQPKLYGRDEFLQTVGSGRIEKRLGLEPGSFRGTDWKQLTRSVRSGAAFDGKSAPYLDDQLGLAFQADGGSNRTAYGFTAADYTDATATVIRSKSPQAVATYQRLVGARALERTLGQFSSKPAGDANLSSGKTGDLVLKDFTAEAGEALGFRLESSCRLPAGASVLATVPGVGCPDAVVAGEAIVPLLGSGSFSSAELAALAGDWALGSRSGRFRIQGYGNTYDAGRYAGNVSEIGSAWLPPLQRAQVRLDALSAGSAARDGKNADLQQIAAAQKAVSRALGAASGYQRAAVAKMQQQGQSGLAAALGIPGSLYRPDGTSITPNVVAGDPMPAIANGDLKAGTLKLFASSVLAARLTDDPSVRNGFAAAVAADGGSLRRVTGQAGTVLAKFGIGGDAFSKRGFLPEDFDRIFVTGAAPATFERIGTQTVLAALEKRSGAGASVDRLAGNPNVGGVLDAASRIAGTFDFYASRYRGVLAQLDALPDEPGVRSLAGQIAEFRRIAPSDPGGAVRQASALLDGLAGLAGTGGKAGQAAGGAVRILNEILAGRELALDSSTFKGLPFSLFGIAGPTGDRRPLASCQLEGYAGFFTALDNDAGGVFSTVGECRIDQALKLPLGTMKKFAEGGTFTYEQLAADVGDVHGANQQYSWSEDEKRTYGRKHLETIAVGALFAAVPGLRQLQGRLGITGTDLARLVSGDGSAVLERVGAGLLDKQLGLAAGTTAGMVRPTCYEPGSRAERACSRAEADTIRSTAIATAGFKQLGLELDLPAGFSLTHPAGSPLAGASFIAALGSGYAAEELGLLPDTFAGGIDDVLGRNRATALSRGFGWYPTPQVAALDRMAAAARAGGLPGGAGAALEKAADELQLDLITRFMKPGAAVTDEGAAAYAERERSGVEAAVTEAQNTLRGLGAAGVRAADAVGGMRSAAPSSPAMLRGQAASFRQRLADLERRYSLPAGSFAGFLAGRTDASSLVASAGRSVLGNQLRKEGLEALKGTFLGPIIAALGTITGTDSCGGGADIATFLTGTGTCSIADSKLSDLLSGTDPANTQHRAAFAEGLLGHALGAKLESGTGMEPGTLRKIIADPARSGEIALQQGLRLLAGQTLKLTLDSGIGGRDGKLARQVSAALLAGFCPVDPADPKYSEFDRLRLGGAGVNGSSKGCSLRFDAERSVLDLTAGLRELSGREGAKYGLDPGDFAMLLAGRTDDTAYRVGAAYTAQGLSAVLTAKPGGSRFAVTKDEIYSAFAPGSVSEPVLAEAGARTAGNDAAEFVANLALADPSYAAKLPAGWQDLPPDAQRRLFRDTETEVVGAENRTRYDAAAEADGRSEGARQLRDRAAKHLQYKLLDATAFNLDPEIPLGFSEAIAEGSGGQKARTIGAYVFSKIGAGRAVFGADSGLSDGDFADLATYVAGGFQGDLRATSLNALDGWFTKNESGLFGFDLPAGTLQGLFAWGTTGFKESTFISADEVQVGGGKYQPIGNVLRTAGYDRLTAWGDKATGLPAGSMFSFFQAGQAVADASRAVRAAQTFQLATKSASLFGASLAGAGDTVVRTARANLLKAQSFAYATAVNTVFASQIGDAERQLGLVPGTGSSAVTLLVQLAMGVPVDPVTLGVFIALNLFGAYGVDIESRATVDGYFPMSGKYGDKSLLRTAYRGNVPPQYPSADPPSEEFDAKDPVAYRAGLLRGARYKVSAVLSDIASFPRRWEEATSEDGRAVWVAQVYTGRIEDLQALDPLISQPAPWDSPAGLGYGSLKNRADLTFDETGGTYVATPKAGFRAGFFADPSFSDEIHVRW